MKNENREILGLNVPVVGIVENLQEAVAAAGSEAAVVADYNSNVLFHSHFTVLRKTIAAVVEKESGITRNKKKHGEKEVYAETEGDYVERVIAELGEDTFNETLLGKVQAACSEIPVDYKPGVRGSGSSTAKPAKKWLEAADQLAKEGRFDGFVAKHNLKGETEDELRVAVANKIKEVITAKLKAAQQQALAGID